MQGKGDPTETPDDLPDKNQGGPNLGIKGARRFAPQRGRRVEFKEIYPFEHGDLWARIPVLEQDLEMYTDTAKKERVSFVFKTRVDIVTRAYGALDAESQ